MLRCRFNANLDDSRPVKWPVKYPYWETGFNDDWAIVVAYVDSLEELYELWPEANQVDSEEVNEITYTSRFQKPDWYKG